MVVIYLKMWYVLNYIIIKNIYTKIIKTIFLKNKYYLIVLLLLLLLLLLLFIIMFVLKYTKHREL